MAGRRVIAYKYLPGRLPWLGTAVVWLLLDRYHAPSWLIGALGALVWIVCIHGMLTQTFIRIAPPHEEEEPKQRRSPWE